MTSQNSLPKPSFQYFGGQFCYLFLTLYLDVQSCIFCRRPMRNRYFYLPGRPQKGSKNDSKKRPSAEGFKRPPRSRNGLQNRPPNWSKNHKFRGPFFFWPLLGPTWASLAPSWPLWVPILPPSCSILGQLGPSWGQVGLPLRPPGPSWCPSCPLSAPSWGKIGQIWACLEPFGAYLAHPGPSSGQLTASLCFYLAVQALLVTGMHSSYLMFQYSTNFAIEQTFRHSIASKCLFSKACQLPECTLPVPSWDSLGPT